MSKDYEQKLQKIRPPFVGSVQFAPVPGSKQNKTLLTDFAFVDRKKFVWQAKAKMPTDGASVPAVLRFAFGKPFDAPQIFSGLVHDAACKDIRDDYDAGRIDWDACIGRRKVADEMFHEACRAAGMGDERAQLYYCGVRIGASFGAGMPVPRADGGVVHAPRVFATAASGLKLPAAGTRSMKPVAIAKGSLLSKSAADSAAQQQALADRLMARDALRRGAVQMNRASDQRGIAPKPSKLTSAEALALEAFERVQARLAAAKSTTVGQADKAILAAFKAMD